MPDRPGVLLADDSNENVTFPRQSPQIETRGKRDQLTRNGPTPISRPTCRPSGEGVDVARPAPEKPRFPGCNRKCDDRRSAVRPRVGTGAQPLKGIPPCSTASSAACSARPTTAASEAIDRGSTRSTRSKKSSRPCQTTPCGAAP